MTGRYVLHPDVDKRVVGAHQRQIVPISSPSIVRHVCLWQSFENKEPIQAADRLAAEDEFVARVYHRLTRLLASGEIAALTGSRLGGPHIAQSNLIEHDGESFVALFGGFVRVNDPSRPTAVEGLVADPYRSVRFAFRWRDMAIAISFESHHEFLLIAHHVELDHVRSGSIWTAGATTVAVGPTVAKLGQTAHAPLRDLQPNDFDLLYAGLWQALDERVLDVQADDLRIGRLVMDSRGLVVRTARNSRTPRAQQTPLAQDSAVCRGLAETWPNVYRDESINTEFTVSGMMDGMALHATSLGHRVARQDGAASIPMRYIVLHDLPNEFQTGRLLYRLNRAGAARVAATMHFEQLNEIGSALRRIEVPLADALWSERKPDDDSAHREEVRKCIDDNSVEMEKIAKREIDGSVPYRSERSRQYVVEFDRVVKDLRLVRVTGYQRYDEYVRQRLGSAFDYIGQLGERYTRAQTGIIELRQLQRTFQALDGGRAIVGAQLTADIALFGILLPYYAASIADHLIGGSHHSLSKDLVWMLAVWFGCRAIYRHRHELTSRGKPTRGWWLWRKIYSWRWTIGTSAVAAWALGNTAIKNYDHFAKDLTHTQLWIIIITFGLLGAIAIFWEWRKSHASDGAAQDKRSDQSGSRREN